jgi:hypothetical protein
MHIKEPVICPSFTELERIETVRVVSTSITLSLCALVAVMAVVAAETWLLTIQF